MIYWSDRGIVLSSKKHGERYKIVNIFTKEHGKFHAMVTVSKSNSFSSFSEVEIDYSSKSNDSLGFWKLKSEKQNWIFSMNSYNHILVSQGICFLLNKLLPQGEKHHELFDFSKHILDNFQNFSDKEILFLYTYFEFELLKYIGLGTSKYLNIPQIRDLSNIKSILEIDSICENAKKFLTFAGRIIEQNFLNIDNYYRSSIYKLI